MPHFESYFVGPFLQWIYQIDEQSQLRISGGPNYVHSKQDSIRVEAISAGRGDQRGGGV